MAPSKLTTDARKKLAANLQVLRRYDSQIESIIDTASHVVLYEFQASTKEWKTKEVEGALFIYKRSAAPYYGFIIMNRVGVENFTELLTEQMSFQTSDQIIIYTSAKSGILGIWIYEETDRTRIPEKLGLCCKNSPSLQPLYPKNSEETKEFARLYPRSRSNSSNHRNNNNSSNQQQQNQKRKNSNARNSKNALSAIIDRTRQQQQQQSQNASNSPTLPSDLVSKLQAIGLNPNQVAGGGGSVETPPADELVLDPAIIVARKSVKPQEEQVGNRGSAFGTPISVAEPALVNGTQLPASPVLHPVPSPFPPSTIATPLPGHGQPLPMYSQYQQQQRMMAFGQQPQMGGGPQFWNNQQQSSSLAFPQLSAGSQSQYAMSSGANSTSVATSGQYPPLSMMPPAEVNPNANAPPSTGGSTNMVAQNLAEQLVSLVQQRMNSIQGQQQQQQQPVASPPARSPMNSAGQQPSAPTGTLSDSMKLQQREYCREWLINVIRADNELVDAFAQRFPPPIFPPP